ncbi:sensor histidine kinase [Streptacidiphilus cavernicola]|uniref:histidine kinase n=1 Tax=Streptacidiphilus cavernicola TaxID=3342716 RepID=A0ABV6W3N6_9ACTN
MRFRSRSIRARIIALLLVPLASLTGLWAYNTATSVNDVWSLTRANSNFGWLGLPSEELVGVLQNERLAAVTYSAAPGNKTSLAALHTAEAATDQVAALVTTRAADSGKVNSLSSGQRTALKAVLKGIKQLPALRAEPTDRLVRWMDVYRDYTDALTPGTDLGVQFSILQSSDLTREAGNLVELGRAREYISREDALMYGARAYGTFDTASYQAFLASSEGEQLLFQAHVDQLPAPEAGLFQDFVNGPVYGDLGSLETAVANLGQESAAQRIDGPKWQTTLNQALSQLDGIDYRTVTLARSRATSYVRDVVWKDAAVGVAGLLAVLVSLMLSLSIGRRLVRELTGLRDSAFELAGVRLPEVMRRLREGERVDLAVEVPQVPVNDGGRDELAQVSRAFNAVQRSAVQAAVEQAELRRGIAAVFVNLARRSQALLHRQLTLLDEMERRVEDPDELEDLFRLDHLTTRMRRHAEGLIILSGSAPGRNWRRPVRILDVVRAAVGEVEDYARVLVHRMPPVAVAGGAVSDVVHLVAELVENAAVFSPPHTQVRIQGEAVANGFVLEIDDRGLGMGEEAMAAANDRLATGGDFDLADTDRLGLFVISRLSARHGVQVSLRRSPYGGTTAVVLLPRDLLAEVPARSGDPVDAPGGGVAEQTGELSLEPNRHRAGRELPRGGSGDGSGGSDGSGGLGGSGGGGGGGRGPVPQRGPRHAAPVPAPALEVQLDGEGGEQGVAALPRRRPTVLPSRAEAYLATHEGSARGPASAERSPAPGVPTLRLSPAAGGEAAADDDGPGVGSAGDAAAPGAARGADGAGGAAAPGGVRGADGAGGAAWPSGDSGELTRELRIRQPSSTPQPGSMPQPGFTPQPGSAPQQAPPSQSAPAAAPPLPGGPSQPGGGSTPPPLLPRRVRQANLAPQLRVATDIAATGEPGRPRPPSDEATPQRERSPEEVRATFSSFQRGLSRGRATPLPADDPAERSAAPVDAPSAARASGANDPSAEGTVR